MHIGINRACLADNGAQISRKLFYGKHTPHSFDVLGGVAFHLRHSARETVERDTDSDNQQSGRANLQYIFCVLFLARHDLGKEPVGDEWRVIIFVDLNPICRRAQFHQSFTDILRKTRAYGGHRGIAGKKWRRWRVTGQNVFLRRRFKI